MQKEAVKEIEVKIEMTHLWGIPDTTDQDGCHLKPNTHIYLGLDHSCNKYCDLIG